MITHNIVTDDIWDSTCSLVVTLDGKWDDIHNSHYDIVSRYKEEIDEDELDELVENENPYKRCTSIPYIEWDKGFKAGYRKVMEE